MGTWRSAITIGHVVQRALEKPLGLSTPADGTAHFFSPKGNDSNLASKQVKYF